MRLLLYVSAAATAAATEPIERSGLGYVRVPVVAQAAAGLQLASAVGYGFTESQLDAPGSHHRIGGRLGATLTPLRGLDLALGSSLRHDAHTSPDALGSDRGTLLSSDLSARVGQQLSSGLHLGLGATASFPGGVDAAHSLQNPALDAQLLAAYVPAQAAWSVGALAGFRYDRRASAVLPPAAYRAGDRLALGSSAFHAVPLGIGGDVRWGPAALVAELSADLLVGSSSPSLGESPWRLSAGARHQLADAVVLTWMTETALSARPGSGASDPLAPIEPRFQLLVGVAYQLLAWGSAPARSAPKAPVTPELPAPAPLAAPAPLPAASLLVNVTTADGYPLSDATVALEREGTTLLVPHFNLQSYRLPEAAAGTATLRVSAPRLKPQSQVIRLESGAALVVDVQLEAAPPGGQLQGLVRALGGRPLRARIRIEPLGLELSTDEAGAFLADVPPGKYLVIVEAPGHESQRRNVQVGPDGVVVLNADLSRAAP